MSWQGWCTHHGLVWKIKQINEVWMSRKQTVMIRKTLFWTYLEHHMGETYNVYPDRCTCQAIANWLSPCMTGTNTKL